MLESITFLAAATAETAGDSSLVGQFGIDLKLIAAQAVNFVVVAFLLWRFAFKPVMVTMDERQRKIAEGLQFAEESRSQLAETEKRHAEIVREANVQSQQILEEARGHARQFEDRMKAETAVQIEEMRKRAEAANEVERQKMLGWNGRKCWPRPAAKFPAWWCSLPPRCCSGKWVTKRRPATTRPLPVKLPS